MLTIYVRKCSVFCSGNIEINIQVIVNGASFRSNVNTGIYGVILHFHFRIRIHKLMKPSPTKSCMLADTVLQFGLDFQRVDLNPDR